MAMGDTPVTIVGNLVADPELKFTRDGTPVAQFRVASTPRRMNQQTQQWEDGDTLFMGCVVWRQAAENAAESLQKGMRVIVQGRLTQRSWETSGGERRFTYEIQVDDFGPSLRNASAKVTRATRGPQQQGYGGQQGYAGGQQQTAPQTDPWASDAGFGSTSEPPF
jgi:single-strand DNA-binding protein